MAEVVRLREAAEVRFFPAVDAARFRRLCSVAELDAFLATDAARSPRVRLADSRREGGAAIPGAEFATAANGRIDLSRLLALHDGGATLVLTQMHEILPALARFCRGLERLFLHPAQCNIYLTPPNAQGFRTHYDSHDVLVLQVEGEKSWRVWPTAETPFANSRTPWKNRPTPGEPPPRMLRPGDALYIPRGVLHDAVSQGTSHSLHLTIGLLGPGWGDALRAALEIAEPDDARLRQAFPTWRLAEGRIPDDLTREAAERLSTLAAPKILELVSQWLLSKLAAEQLPMVGRGLVAPNLSPDDRLQLADTVHYFVTPRPDGGADLRWAGETVALTSEEFAWLDRLGDGAAAGDLGGAEALAFCQRLSRLGLVIAKPDMRPSKDPQ